MCRVAGTTLMSTEFDVIVAKPKTFAEVLTMVGQRSRILVAGCGTCVAVCLAGGEKEAELLATRLNLALAGPTPGRVARASCLSDSRLEVCPSHGVFQATAATVERQCDREFLRLFKDHLDGVDGIVSLACGAGIQFIAEMYPRIPVFPGVDTSFIGVAEAAGVWTERCRSCNQCYLGITGGICPVTMCAKGLLNGPCGGPNKGKCETSPEKDCAWVKIIERLEAQSRLDLIREYVPPRNFDLTRHPDKVVREEYPNATGKGRCAEK